ncbi:hypothetical protein, partial [Pseudomonas sp. SIMBA_044]|uniref:hypothetical protein n=1 Tax=Pseudomonas sp. SIMBA_044 TaxID=3085785 RepID=UPI00397BBE4C
TQPKMVENPLSAGLTGAKRLMGRLFDENQRHQKPQLNKPCRSGWHVRSTIKRHFLPHGGPSCFVASKS